MATIADVQTALGTISGLKVFSDGEIFGDLHRNRTIKNVPFVEIREIVSDYTDHTSTSRKREVEVEGQITAIQYRDEIKDLREALIGAFTDEDLLHLTIRSYTEEGRLLRVAFTVEFYDTDEKT